MITTKKINSPVKEDVITPVTLPTEKQEIVTAVPIITLESLQSNIIALTETITKLAGQYDGKYADKEKEETKDIPGVTGVKEGNDESNKVDGAADDGEECTCSVCGSKYYKKEKKAETEKDDKEDEEMEKKAGQYDGKYESKTPTIMEMKATIDKNNIFGFKKNSDDVGPQSNLAKAAVDARKLSVSETNNKSTPALPAALLNKK